MANPITAVRLATIGTYSCNPTGPLTTAGTACYMSTAFGGRSGGHGILDWLGNRYAGPVAGSWSSAPAVAPAPGATSVVVCCDGNNVTGNLLLSGDGGPSLTPLAGRAADWVCWMDQTHVLSGTASSPPGASAVLNLMTRQAVPAGAGGYCAGALPSDLG